jgi:hypothetical protein
VNPVAALVGCVVAALAAGMLAAASIHGADAPGAWSHPGWLWDFALSAALVYMVAPLCVLALLLRMGRRASTGLCVGVALAWFAGVFAVWVALAWVAEGAFPVWGWRHYSVDMLPIPLAMGLVFSMVARTLLPARAGD